MEIILHFFLNFSAKLFPHEIVDLEPLFEIYKTIPANEWETKYILLLWLSMIVINPFDLTVVDPTNQLPRKMLEECKAQLSEPGKTRDSASLLISRLLTRPDMAKEQLPDFVKWGIETLSNSKTTTFLVCIDRNCSIILKWWQLIFQRMHMTLLPTPLYQ